jgi:hypothetical protein
MMIARTAMAAGAAAAAVATVGVAHPPNASAWGAPYARNSRDERHITQGRSGTGTKPAGQGSAATGAR